MKKLYDFFLQIPEFQNWEHFTEFFKELNHMKILIQFISNRNK